MKEFIEAFDIVATEVHNTAIEKGWWDELKAGDWLSGKTKTIVAECKADDYNIEVWLKSAFNAGKKNPERNESELVMLQVSELAEGMEGLRKDLDSDHIPGFKMIEEELADTIIRIMDHAKKKNYRVAEALIRKMEFNKTRDYKHGNKKF